MTNKNRRAKSKKRLPEWERLRIKAYLIVRRNTTRDFIDFAALFDHLGVRRALQALDPLDRLYPQEGAHSISQQLVLQLAEPKPWDLSQTDLSRYKSLKPPYTDWSEIKRRTASAAQKILLRRLGVAAPDAKAWKGSVFIQERILMP